ncbi:bactofilin family protein [Acetivibrio mesophilus]|uniref:Polymer-forming cytoskeletal protein n=1 Tax=Acetivibrio mesophilus TaxID=2487273 RepID=A0A4Q0I494_9FIRM|nr:polymer-forming cytoskeletal protein [Acetivibrio mesophilus]ODM26545.1 cell shape determination protein CcmA [Clostridium sp. Bc-iso-3]RXE58535.1 polymer-forming cytoskeletal protein [Acetivibrio mesophilus]HHV30631.1 polymer-forming cytoskeletal protein [Clostridium sp.]
MFNKKESSNPDVFDTLIGINSTLEGNIETEGTIRVDGKINGDVKVKGDVYIGKDANVNGNIVANNVHVSGRVNGNIEAKGILRALSTAQLYGDILVQSLISDEGSIFEGNCKMIPASNSQNSDNGISSKSKSVKDKEKDSNKA